jgi:hypothetical protein
MFCRGDCGENRGNNCEENSGYKRGALGGLAQRQKQPQHSGQQGRTEWRSNHKITGNCDRPSKLFTITFGASEFRRSTPKILCWISLENIRGTIRFRQIKIQTGLQKSQACYPAMLVSSC